jgi:hypothetical protein
MNYLIDSDWVIDYLKGKANTVTRLRNLVVERLGMSLITYVEVY